MNWKTIKKRYPKSFLLLITHFGICEYEPGSLLNRWNDTSKKLHLGHGYIPPKLKPNKFLSDRDLYDFFDEQRLYINAENIGHKSPQFRSVIKQTEYMKYTWINPKGVSTRQKAETEAFTKAFELLESQ